MRRVAAALLAFAGCARLEEIRIAASEFEGDWAAAIVQGATVGTPLQPHRLGEPVRFAVDELPGFDRGALIVVVGYQRGPPFDGVPEAILERDPIRLGLARLPQPSWLRELRVEPPELSELDDPVHLTTDWLDGASDGGLSDGGSQAGCGDSLRRGSEECDLPSPGCRACRVEPGWLCRPGSCVPTGLTVTATAIDLGRRFVGDVAARTITITNSSTEAATIVPTLPDGATAGCTAIGPGEACELTVSIPTRASATYTEALSIGVRTANGFGRLPAVPVRASVESWVVDLGRYEKSVATGLTGIWVNHDSVVAIADLGGKANAVRLAPGVAHPLVSLGVRSVSAISAGPGDTSYLAGSPLVRALARLGPDLQVSASWTVARQGTDENSGAARLAYDPVSGHVAICGLFSGAWDGFHSLGVRDSFIALWDPALGTLWTDQIGTDRDDVVRSVAIAPNGEVWVAGASAGNLGPGPSGPRSGAFVARYDALGQRRSLEVITGTASFARVLILPGGDALALGGRGQGRRLVARFDPAGAVIEVEQDDAAEIISDAAFDSGGNLILIGAKYVEKQGPRGARLWSRAMGGEAKAMAVDESDRIYVGLQAYSVATVGLSVIRLTPDGDF